MVQAEARVGLVRPAGVVAGQVAIKRRRDPNGVFRGNYPVL
ncbi:hypothetical protein ABH927_001546 [Planotetraspora sp. GP83]